MAASLTKTQSYAASQYAAQTSGTALTVTLVADDYLWIRQTLATTDADVTPTLTEMVVEVVAAATLTQFGFQFYQDNADHTTIGTENDASVSLAPGSKFRIRMGIDADGDPASKDFQLEYSHKPASTGVWKGWRKTT